MHIKKLNINYETQKGLKIVDSLNERPKETLNRVQINVNELIIV